MNLHQQLQSYTSDFPEEQEFRKVILQFLASTEKHFSRENVSGHITASALLLNSDCSKFLLMHHAKLGKWFQPGGHCDGRENTLEVAIKESQEESGIEQIQAIRNTIYDIDVHLIPANSKDQAHYHYDIRFLLKTTGNDNLVQNHEAKELKWIEIKEYEKSNILLEKSITRMLKKLQTLSLRLQ